MFNIIPTPQHIKDSSKTVSFKGAQIVNNLQSSMASSERVFAVLDEPEEVADKYGKGIEFKDVLKFENVSFSYSPDKPLMENLDISVKCGGLVALVGPTGAGKTTFSTAMAIQAAIQGYNVLQIVFEE